MKRKAACQYCALQIRFSAEAGLCKLVVADLDERILQLFLNKHEDSAKLLRDVRCFWAEKGTALQGEAAKLLAHEHDGYPMP